MPKLSLPYSISDFDIAKTFLCGQAFRFFPEGPGAIVGIAFGRAWRLVQGEADITIECDEMDEQLTRRFLSLDDDYEGSVARLSADESLTQALAYGQGLRMLTQDLWECLMSFILSQNANIPRIQRMIASLCERAGERIGEGAYAFPTPGQVLALGESALGEMKLGYRAGYVYGSAKAVYEGDCDLGALSCMESGKARSELMKLKGVGGKVADCALLFGLHRLDTCPFDVWVRRILKEKYSVDAANEAKAKEFVRERWGEDSGLAQQFLYFAERNGYDGDWLDRGIQSIPQRA